MATETKNTGVEMVTLTIDGKEATVPKGTLVIEAAKTVGIDIPYLCYHHKLTPFGGCRLCLVEVEKVPKMLASCNTEVAPGMVVRTDTERCHAQRKGTLEFILLNHPLDCPVCDKGGECELQDRVYDLGAADSRLTEPKVHIADYDLGPLIVRNQDRCIICKRCVKVMEEVVGDPVLEFGGRGVTTEIITFAHEDFAPGFSGNTIQVCPVGALMSKPFRFKARPWELIKTPSVCSGCGVGCNYRQDSRENRILRVVGLENEEVNDGWLCDRGQFGYDYPHSKNRLSSPLLRRSRDEELEPASWEEALAFVAERFQEIRDRDGGKALGALGSERFGNEDAFVFQQLVRGAFQSRNLDHRAVPGREDYAALRPAPGAIKALGQADVVLLFASDLTSEAPVLDLILKRGLLPKTLRLIVAHPRRIKLSKFAAQQLRYAPGAEAALAAALVKALLEEGLAAPDVDTSPAKEGLEQHSLADLCAAAGVSEEEVREAARAYAGAERGALVYGGAAAEGWDGAATVGSLLNLALLAGQAGKPGSIFLEAVRNCNTWGARDMGLLPFAGPGGSEAPRGLNSTAMLQAARKGDLKALYVAGSNPAVDFPAGTEEALRATEFLVVQDLFLTETAKLADVVLPAAAAAEKNATLTNLEGRVQRAVRSLSPHAGSRPDWEIFAELSALLEQPLGYSGVADVAPAIRAALEAAAGCQPAPPRPRRVEIELPEAPPAEFPLRLLTGTLMFDRGSVQGQCEVLPTLCPDPYVELHPETAASLGVKAGQRVRIASPHGEIEREARVSEDTPAGAAFIPAGYNSSSVAHLLGEDGRAAGVKLAPA